MHTKFIAEVITNSKMVLVVEGKTDQFRFWETTHLTLP